MMPAILATPASYILLGLALTAGIGNLAGWWRARFTLPAGLGLLAFLLSTLAQDFWRLGSTIEGQIFAWQAGIAFSGAVYAVSGAVLPPRPPVFLSAALLVAWLIVAGLSAGPVELQKAGELFLLLVVTIIVYRVGRQVPRADFLGRMVWTLLLLYEALGALLYLDCQILHEFGLPRELGSACDRQYVTPVSWLNPVVIGFTMAYLFIRGARRS